LHARTATQSELEAALAEASRLRQPPAEAAALAQALAAAQEELRARKGQADEVEYLQQQVGFKKGVIRGRDLGAQDLGARPGRENRDGARRGPGGATAGGGGRGPRRSLGRRSCRAPPCSPRPGALLPSPSRGRLAPQPLPAPGPPDPAPSSRAAPSSSPPLSPQLRRTLRQVVELQREVRALEAAAGGGEDGDGDGGVDSRAAAAQDEANFLMQARAPSGEGGGAGV
jgi:hypothetical protein